MMQDTSMDGGVKIITMQLRYNLDLLVYEIVIDCIFYMKALKCNPLVLL